MVETVFYQALHIFDQIFGVFLFKWYGVTNVAYLFVKTILNFFEIGQNKIVQKNEQTNR